MEQLTKCIINIPKEQIDQILSEKIKILEKENKRLLKQIEDLKKDKEVYRFAYFDVIKLL